MTEGTKHGDVNRPGSVPEIPKLPVARCRRCKMMAAVGIVVQHGNEWYCKNDRACDKRILRALKQATRPKPPGYIPPEQRR